ncbi:unnamed protein product, partial [Closterium sp. NIES-53]
MDSTSGAAAFTCRVLDLARRLAALDVVFSHHTPAEAARRIITTEAEILCHSTSTVAVAQPRSSRGGRGGGHGGGRGGGCGGGHGGGRGRSPGRGGSGSGGAGRGAAAAFPP